MLKRLLAVTLALCLFLLSACEPSDPAKDDTLNKTESGEQETTTGGDLGIKPADAINPDLGFMPTLVYSSDKKVVFYDYLGVFVYSLEENKLLHDFSLSALGYKNTQGDGAVQVRYDEAKDKVALFSDMPERVITVDLSSGKVETIDKEAFEKFPEEHREGKMGMDDAETEHIYYQAEGSEEKVYVLKDWEGAKAK